MAKTVIVTGGSQGIGSGAVKAFLDRDYNARNFAQCHQVERPAFVAEAGLGGWRYWGRHYSRKSGGNSH